MRQSVRVALNAGPVQMLAAVQTAGLEIATTLVALYAAVIATLSLGFQAYSWLRTRPTRLGGSGETASETSAF